MLNYTPTGTWLPAWVPESSSTIAILLLFCSAVQSVTGGYDGSMLNGLNILPSYTNYFRLNAATTGLNTASVFIGGILGPVVSGFIADRFGRRPAIFWGCVITIIGVIIQSAAQDIAMFVVGRIFLGFGSALAGIASGVYLSETFPSRWRAWGVGLLNDFYYVGALIAAGITLRTGQWHSTWAWRAPSIFQGLFSIVSILILPFIPESPRWLVFKDYPELARRVVAQTNANNDEHDPVVLAVYKEIIDTIRYEKEENRTMTAIQMVKDPVTRKRLVIGMSAGPFSCVAGNVIASYYLGQELDTAGITSYDAQLKANVVLNVWCLGCALAGTQLCARWGRKPTALISQVLLIICLLIIGGLSKMVADNKGHVSNALAYGDVSIMFLFQGFYSVAWTPLLFLYPPEVMNYSIRANGVAFSQFMLNACAIVLTYTMPISLTKIGWKTYIINAAWDVIVVFLIWYYWVETKGKTLEEIDAIFEGVKHSDVPDVELVRRGEAKLATGLVEEFISLQPEKTM